MKINRKFEKEKKWILNEKYNGKKKIFYFFDILKLYFGVPTDYIIGFREFIGAKINLKYRPLIPREETEFWVKNFLDENFLENGAQPKAAPLKILDIFSGSGCIGISVLKNTKNTIVHFSEIDKKLCGQIKFNLDLNNIEKKRYKIFSSDIFENIPKEKYNFILANPPYVSEKNGKNVQKSVLMYEPKKAVFGGADGLFFIKKFLKEAPSFVEKNGKIYLEFDEPERQKIFNFLTLLKTKSFSFKKDQFGKYRILILRKKALSKK